MMCSFYSLIYTISTIILLSPAVMSASCSICTDGSNRFKLDKIVDPATGLTCGNAELSTAALGDEEECNRLSLLASWCECPGAAPACPTFACPVGHDFIDPTVNALSGTQITCGDLNYLAHTSNSSELCETIDSAYVGTCGACIASSVNRDPSQTPTPAAPTPGPTLTPVLTPADNDQSGCGSLCPDGEPVHPSFTNKLISDREDTVACGQLEATLPHSNVFFESCDIARYVGVSQCGCADTLPPIPADAACYICEDMSVPQKLSYNVLPELTCRGVGFFVASYNETECDVTQSVVGAYCGCENSVREESVCRICGENNLLPDPSRVLADSTIGDIRCLDLELNANAENAECSQFQGAWAPSCCSSGSPSPASTSSSSFHGPIYPLTTFIAGAAATFLI